MSWIPDNCRRGRLTEAEDAEIVRLTEADWTTSRISQRMRRHPSTIHFARTRLGLVAPNMTRRPSYTRRGKAVIAFDGPEDAYLTEARIAGDPLRLVAEVIRVRFGRLRTVATLRVRLMMLANAAEAAMKGQVQ